MSIVKNSPEMNIVNQINAALNDVRTTMIELATRMKTLDVSDQTLAEDKMRYQFDLAVQMIRDHRRPDKPSRPWSELKHQVEEEFS